MIRYFTEDTTFTLKGKRLVSKWLREVAEDRGFEIGELNYIFCSDPYLLAINRQFLGHDYETDIDLVVKMENWINGKAYGEGFDREMHRVIVHGLLHLIGYDDCDDWHRSRMRAAENRALAELDQMKEA